MHRTVWIGTLVSLAALNLWAPAALGQPGSATASSVASEAFTAASAAFADEDFALALQHFQNALDAGITGPAIHYNLGVCFYKLGRYDEAAAEFTLVAEGYPRMRGLAEYNLGLIAQRRGDDARARVHFRRALGESEDESVRQLARMQLEGTDGDADTKAEAEPEAEPEADAPPSPSWVAIVDARLGYDDNVLLLADEIQLPDGQSAESGFLEAWGVVSRPPTSGSGFRLDGSFYLLRYPEASIFDQSVLDFSAPYVWQWRAWRGEAGPRVGWTTIDGDLLDRRIGVSARITRDLGERFSLGLRYEHDEIEEGRSRFAFFSGNRDRAELALDRFGARARLTLAYSYESNDRESPTVSPERNKLSLRYRVRVSPDWLVEAIGSVRDSRYRGAALRRDEHLEEIALGVTRLLPDDWRIGGEVAVADNDSDLRTVEYRRNRMSFGVSKQF